MLNEKVIMSHNNFFRYFGRLLICLLVLFPLACAKAPPAQQMEFALGTVCSVNLYDDGNGKLYARIF